MEDDKQEPSAHKRRQKEQHQPRVQLGYWKAVNRAQRTPISLKTVPK